jgi:hypothetical protein
VNFYSIVTSLPNLTLKTSFSTLRSCQVSLKKYYFPSSLIFSTKRSELSGLAAVGPHAYDYDLPYVNKGIPMTEPPTTKRVGSSPGSVEFWSFHFNPTKYHIDCSYLFKWGSHASIGFPLFVSLPETVQQLLPMPPGAAINSSSCHFSFSK